VPPFQAPDEAAHVAYVQSLAERGKLPGDPARELRSTEHRLGADAANSDQVSQQLPVKPEWSARRHEEWLGRAKRLSSGDRGDGGGPNPASANPPLYYLWMVAPYELASGGDLFARVSAMRLASVPFLLISVIAAWLLAGTIFGPDRPLQLAAASFPALLPMVTFISSSVNPDALLYALSGLVLWLGARVVIGEGGLRDIVALCVLAGLAVLTKATAYALLPAVALAVVGALWRTHSDAGRLVLRVAAGLGVFFVLVGAWYLVARANDRPVTGQLFGTTPGSQVNVREFGSYVWQYYLPRLPFQRRYGGLGEYPQSYETWFKRAVGAFGFLEVRWTPAVYAALVAVWLSLLGAALVALVKRRRRVDPVLLAFFATAVLSLLVGLHWTEYRNIQSSGQLLNQGRYLFPLISLAGLVPAAALTIVPARGRPGALGALIGGLVVLQLFAIGLVATRFYA
jgi:4-amino-4-deoxy-L-arabinose transferase-like glycosyltransferase